MGQYNDDSDFDFLSDSDDEKKPVQPQITSISGPSNRVSSNGASSSNSNTMSKFLAMGFPEELVLRAIRESGEENSGGILDLILTYQAIKDEEGQLNNEKIKQEDDIDWDYDDLNDDFDDFDLEEEMSGRAAPERKLRTLMEMGFSRDEAELAINICGDDAPVDELADSISAAQTAELYSDAEAEKRKRNNEKYDPFSNKRPKPAGGRINNFNNRQKKPASRAPRVPRPKRQPGDFDLECDEAKSMPLPNPMVGFGLPNDPHRIETRTLPQAATPLPYFFYENVALAPKGVWDEISWHLDGVMPEFVDSKYFSAAARKRGYVHNLPIDDRFPLLPVPPKTIAEAFPQENRWWPAWDTRTQFNCLQTCIGSATLVDRIRASLENSEDPPPNHVRKYVMYECKKWNLRWVGRNMATPLDADEFEFLLGFPQYHTRAMSRTERYRSLGNSFQIDTVAYLLSPLKRLFPDGMRVLSLFSGIGGAEVALHRLGIQLNLVVSVEISASNRGVLRAWWGQTGQMGTLIDFDDVKKVTHGQLKSLIERYGAFDLVIGGSPCNNLAGSNRHDRSGLEGAHSSLFFDYVRILESVRSLMRGGGNGI